MRCPIPPTLLIATILSIAAISACGADTPPPATPSTPSAPPADTTPAAPAPSATASSTASSAPTPSASEAPAHASFRSLPKEKKVEVMMQKVVPVVGKDFKELDGKRFASFGCATCHGPKKNEDPHEVIPKLTLSNGGFEKLQKTKPEIVKFMMEKVTPHMAEALGEKPFDPQTQTGFGCGGCHTVK